MSVVMVKCGNPLCRSEFGVADPDGVWETDQELAQDQGWHVDGALVACSGECLTLARVAALVTSDAIELAAQAAVKAEDRKVCVVGYLVFYSLSRGWPVRSPRSVDLAQQAVADQHEASALYREAHALAGAA